MWPLPFPAGETLVRVSQEMLSERRVTVEALAEQFRKTQKERGDPARIITDKYLVDDACGYFPSTRFP